MRKLVAIVVIAALSAVVAQADYYINMSVNYGVYNNTGTGGVIPNAGDTAVLQLFYVGANGTADYASAVSLGTLGDITGTAPDGDDVLIGEFSFVSSGSGFSIYAFPASGTISNDMTGFLGSDVYGRLIGAGQNGITAGDWYYQGSVISANDKTLPGSPPATPDLYALDGGVPGQWAQMGQVIPEPATFSLMGIATVGAFLYRRRRVGSSAVERLSFTQKVTKVEGSFLDEETDAAPLG